MKNNKLAVLVALDQGPWVMSDRAKILFAQPEDVIDCALTGDTPESILNPISIEQCVNAMKLVQCMKDDQAIPEMYRQALHQIAGTS